MSELSCIVVVSMHGYHLLVSINVKADMDEDFTFYQTLATSDFSG